MNTCVRRFYYGMAFWLTLKPRLGSKHFSLVVFLKSRLKSVVAETGGMFCNVLVSCIIWSWGFVFVRRQAVCRRYLWWFAVCVLHLPCLSFYTHAFVCC